MEGIRFPRLRRSASIPVAAFSAALLAALAGCRQPEFPTYPANYREYAYIANGDSDTVTVLDVVNMRVDRVIAVGRHPAAVASNPRRNEVYVVESGGNAVAVIDAETNQVTGSIPVQRRPQSIDVDAEGRRAYVSNSGSNTVSVLDLSSRRAIGSIPVGQNPGVARISPDRRTLVVANRGGGVTVADAGAFKARSSFTGCPDAEDAAILPDSSKAFVACSGADRVLVVGLAHDGDEHPSRGARLLSYLVVGKSPVQIALKPDGGEAFVSNFDSGTVSEIATPTNEVGGSTLVGSHPVRGLVSADNSLLYLTNFSAGRVAIYSIDDGKLEGSVKVGEGPDAMAFSTAGNILFVVDSQSGDVAAVRTRSNPQALLTLFPAGRRPNSIAIKAFRLP